MINRLLNQNCKLLVTQIFRQSAFGIFILLFFSIAFIHTDAMASSRMISISEFQGSVTKYEAEDAVLSGVTVAKSLMGFSGTGYMDGGSFDLATDKITFTVNVPKAAAYPLIIRYQNTCGICEKAQNISVNGGADKYTSFNAAATGWQDLNVGDVDLKAGNNTIAISKSWGYTHIDYIGIGENDVAVPSAPANLKSSGLSQTSIHLSWDTATDNVGVTGYDVYFGNTLKTSTTSTSVTILNLTCGTEYQGITIKAKDKAGNVSEASNSISLSTGSCVSHQLTVNGGQGSGSFNSGEIIKITANSAPAGKIFDKWIGSTAIANPAIAITVVIMPEINIEITATYKDIDPALLLDPNASAETVNLWNYLKSIYGQKMLTGCWTETQFGGNAKVVSCTGETPAIWGQDMNSWYRSRTETLWKQTWDSNIQGFKNAHKRGQILQVNWHWQMPSSKVNGAYTRDAWGRDASNISVMMTNQQWSDIVTPGTALYDAMIEDVDYHIVNFLKKIVDEKGVPIPILFRPLHEIDGGWFWWTCTSDPTKTARLFKILQDRIINFHGCHNLIWIYNPGVICDGGSWPPYQTSELARRKAFFPGEAYCDLTGIDLYDFDPAVRGTYSSTGKTYRDAWNTMKAIAPSKMIALCEAEGIPNPEKCFTDANYAPWLYCLPWYSDSYSDGTSAATRDLCAWNKVQFKNDYVVNAGDLNITSIASLPDHKNQGINIFPNPSTESVNICFQTDDELSKALLTMIDLTGKTAFTTEIKNGKTLQLNTSGFRKGLYIVKVKQNKQNFSQKLIIE